MPDPMLFDRVAEVYERARPPYPAPLVARLAELGLTRPGTRVLDVGAGTGQATAILVAAGCRVDAVEPGPALSARLAARLSAVAVLRTTIEEAVLEPATYDAVVSATAFHWVDLEVTLPKLYDALRPGGLLAVWWTVFGDPDARSPFRARIDEIVVRRTDPGGSGSLGPLDTASWLAALTDRGLFEPVHTEQFRWSVDLGAAQVHDLFTTFNGWTVEEVDEVSRAAQELGGRVTERYVSALYVLRATSRSAG